MQSPSSDANSAQLITEHVMRTSTGFDNLHRIRLYNALLTMLPDPEPRAEIARVITTLRAADQACREFSFIRDEDKI